MGIQTMNPDAQEWIECVAFLLDDGRTLISLPRPARHHHVIRHMTETGHTVEQIAQCEQGFLTNLGQWADRQTARSIAVAAGQVDPNATFHPEMLFSEDVW